jgi:hypothetical protein
MQGVVANCRAVLNVYGVVVTCRMSSDGSSKWMVKREKVEVLAEYLAWCGGREGAKGFFILLLVGSAEEKGWGEWRRPFVAQLSSRGLRIATEKIIPWLKEVRALPLHGLGRRLDAHLFSDASYAWEQVASALFRAVVDGVFSDDAGCYCSIEAICAVCRNTLPSQRVFGHAPRSLNVATSAWV